MANIAGAGSYDTRTAQQKYLEALAKYAPQMKQTDGTSLTAQALANTKAPELKATKDIYSNLYPAVKPVETVTTSPKPINIQPQTTGAQIPTPATTPSVDNNFVQKVSDAITQYKAPSAPQIDYSGQISSMQAMYDTQQKAQQIENQRKTDNQIADYNSQKEIIPGQFNDLRTAQNVRSVMDQQRKEQELAAMGINRSGEGDTQRISLETGNRNALNNFDVQQQKQLSDLDKAISQARANGASQDSQIVQQLTSERNQALFNIQNAQNDNAWKVYNAMYQQNRDNTGDTRYNQEYTDSRGDVIYNRDYQTNRDSINDTGMINGQFTQQGALNQSNIQMNQAELQEKTNPNSITNQMARLGLDTAKLNYAALPQQLKDEATITLQQIENGKIDIATGKAQLKELTDPNSITNQMNRIGLNTAKLNYAALPQQIKDAVLKSAQDLQKGNIDMKTAQAQIDISRQNANTNAQELAWRKDPNNPTNIIKADKQVATDIKPYQAYISKYFTENIYNNMDKQTGVKLNQKAAAQYIIDTNLDETLQQELLSSYGLPTDLASLKKLLGR